MTLELDPRPPQTHCAQTVYFIAPWKLQELQNPPSTLNVSLNLLFPGNCKPYYLNHSIAKVKLKKNALEVCNLL